MRSSLLSLPILLLLAGCPKEQAGQHTAAPDTVVTKNLPVPGKQGAAPAKVELTTTKFKVEGMDCKDCSKAIESKLIGTAGVSTVSADEKAGVVIVEYDPARIRKTEIIAAIDSLKFRASVME